MRTYKALALGAAIVIIVFEALLFSRASKDAPDIGTPISVATPESAFVPAAQAAVEAAFNRAP